MANAVVRAHKGGLGADPLVGSRSRAPGQGVQGEAPFEAEALLFFWHSVEAYFF